MDFIKSNVQTISDGKLLISGGAYKISMFSNTKKLKLKENESITVLLPRLTNDEMSLFYGQKDSLGNITWLKTEESLEPAVSIPPPPSELGLLDKINSDTTKTSYIDYYSPIQITSLDWINCDRFYDINEKTNLNINIETSQDTLVARVYLIFRDINSVMSSVYIKSNENICNEGFSNIPINSNVRIVAVSLIDDKILGFSMDFKIQKNEKIMIDLLQMTEKELNDLINKK